MTRLLSKMKGIGKGHTLLRVLMNQAFEKTALHGVVVDVGGGRSPDYFAHFDMRGVQSVTSVDASLSPVDFERDSLPFADESIDTVLCVNVLEHIYNHQFLIKEMRRILKPDGTLVGFVPFCIQYHPDPHDYFRYTKEALQRMSSDAGFTHVLIQEVGGGPFAVNYNNLMLSVPRLVRLILFPVYWSLDVCMLRLRSGVRARYPLGYYFELRS